MQQKLLENNEGHLGWSKRINRSLQFLHSILSNAMMLNLHLQYALHTTSFAEQPISDKTLSRFRKRCYHYETVHNVDLYHDCVKDLGSKMAKIMSLNGRIKEWIP